MFYITDTGRRWDGDEFSVRDKVENSGQRTEVRDPQITQITPVPSPGATGQARIREKGTGVAPVESPSGCSSRSPQ